MKKNFAHRISAALLVLVYLMTPYTALGFGHDTCDCTVNGVACGTDGLICSCCYTERVSAPCDETAFTQCQVKTHADPFSLPPAVNEPLADADTALACTDTIDHKDFTSLSGFGTPAFKPPRVA